MELPVVDPGSRMMPAEAAAAVVNWHTANYNSSPMTDVAEAAINYHTGLRGLNDEGSIGLGMWHLLASVCEYVNANGGKFGEMLTDVLQFNKEEPYLATVAGTGGRHGGSLTDDGDPVEIGSWHLLATLAQYSDVNCLDFRDTAQDAMNEVAADAGPNVVPFR